MKGGGTRPLNALEVTSARGGGLATMPAHLFTCTFMIKAATSSQSTDPPAPEATRAAPGTHARLLAGGGGGMGGMERRRMDSCYHAGRWNWFEFNHNLPWSLPLAVAGLQSSKMVTLDGVCQCNCCLGAETGSWCSLLCHLPRTLSEPRPGNYTSLPGKTFELTQLLFFYLPAIRQWNPTGENHVTEQIA